MVNITLRKKTANFLQKNASNAGAARPSGLYLGMNLENIKKFACATLEKVPGKYLYHSWRHTINVVKYAPLFARQSGLSEPEIELITAAAWLHDLGFIYGAAGHEAASAAIAAEALPPMGVSPGELEDIQTLIMATIIPARPFTVAEMVICDADVEYLGRAEFYELSTLLRMELFLLGRGFTELEWLDFEIKFLTNQKFFSPAARRLRNAGKLRHLRELESYRRCFGGGQA